MKENTSKENERTFESTVAYEESTGTNANDASVSKTFMISIATVGVVAIIGAVKVTCKAMELRSKQ